MPAKRSPRPRPRPDLPTIGRSAGNAPALPRSEPIGAIYSFRVPDGRFGAAHVIGEAERGWVALAALRRLWPTPPSPADVDAAPAFQPISVTRDVPWWATFVTRQPPKRTHEGPSSSFGSWHSAMSEYWCQLNAYIAGVERPPLPAWAADLGDGDTIRYEGGDARVAELVRTRRVRTLHWRVRGAARIDLAACDALVEAHIDVGDEPLTLRLPRALVELHVSGKVDRLRVERDAPVFPFVVHVDVPVLPQPIAGLEDLEELDGSTLREADLRRLAGYRRLSELVLQGKAISVTCVEMLAALPTLRRLTLRHVYDLDAERFPAPWPALAQVEIHGLRTATATTLKKKLAVVPALKITGAKSDAFIAENLQNPFRGWDEDDPQLGRAAGAAWRKAQAAAAAPRNTSAARAEPILRALVDALNRLDAKHGLDTLRREEAADAFLGLAADLGVARAMAERWFDEWREF